MKKIIKFVEKYLHYLIVAFVALLCIAFLIVGHTNDKGYVSLTGGEVEISESTKEFIESSQAALNRIMNEDKPTDEQVERENDEDAVGLGFHTSIDDILGRRLNDGNNDNGNGWQCSRYTAWLATGKWSYSASHPDYGPVNGKDIAAWLVNNYGFKYIDTPVPGAIGSGGFNTLYGHTVMYLYSTGANTAMVNDANWTPLSVSTHNMNIDGWVWVVPGDYEPTPTPTPEPEPIPEPTISCDRRTLQWGDTLGKIMLECEGYVAWGEAMNDYARSWVDESTGVYVFDGWNSSTGIGLYTDHTIVKK